MTDDAVTGDAVVAIAGMSYSYGNMPVLTNVDLAIRDGDFVSVVGPNGGGKTTLLKLMLGLLIPRSGEVRVFGRRPQTARSRIGYVPQHFQFDEKFPMSVQDVVLMGRLGSSRFWGPYRAADRKAALEALRCVELLSVKDRSFAALSGGQRQRVLIARALASEPELLLLDEPLAHVDVVVVDDLYKLFKELNRTLTIVLVSHDVGFVSRLVQRVVCVNRTVTTHPTSELSGAVMSQLYGTEVSMVRHDLHGGGEDSCTNS